MMVTVLIVVMAGKRLLRWLESSFKSLLKDHPTLDGPD